MEVPKQDQIACSHTECKHKGPGKLKGFMHSAWEKGGQEILDGFILPTLDHHGNIREKDPSKYLETQSSLECQPKVSS